MTKEKYQKEIKLIQAQNNTEIELYPLATEIIQTATEGLSKRYVFGRKKSKKGNVYYGLSSFPDIAILDKDFKDTDRDEIKEDDWNGLIGSLEIKALGNKLFNIDEIRECLLNKEKKVNQDEGQLIGEILWYKKVLYTNGIEWEYFYVDKYSKELKESILKIVNNRIAFEKVEAEKQQSNKTYQKIRYDWWSEFKKIYDKNIIVCNDCITKNCMNDWDDFIDRINKINWK